MKTHYTFHRVYYDIFKRLKYPKNVLFIDVLSHTLLLDGYGEEHAKKVSFSDSELDEEWKLVLSKLKKRDRNTPEYKQWRCEVFERDKYTCQVCWKSGVKLNAHHIKRWADNEELRLDVNNGLTLCEPCHKTEHKAGKYEKVI